MCLQEDAEDTSEDGEEVPSANTHPLKIPDLQGQSSFIDLHIFYYFYFYFSLSFLLAPLLRLLRQEYFCKSELRPLTFDSTILIIIRLSSTGRLPLHIACQYGAGAEVVHALLQRMLVIVTNTGRPFEVTSLGVDNMNRTPLHVASSTGNVKVSD